MIIVCEEEGEERICIIYKSFPTLQRFQGRSGSEWRGVLYSPGLDVLNESNKNNYRVIIYAAHFSLLLATHVTS